VKDALLDGVDEDTDAFSAYMDAMRLPKNTPEEKAARKAAMQEGLKKAVAVPLETARLSLRALALAGRAAEKGNKNSVSDAGVGAQMAFAGLKGALLNVLINLPGIEDAAFVAEMRAEAARLEEEARAMLESTMAVVLAKIGA
jgi:glutamate formiminotransferase/formiminotetrahydrofolate cyclodeaminase